MNPRDIAGDAEEGEEEEEEEVDTLPISHTQARRHGGRQDVLSIRWPQEVGGISSLELGDLLLLLDVPELHMPRQVAKASQAQEWHS